MLCDKPLPQSFLLNNHLNCSKLHLEKAKTMLIIQNLVNQIDLEDVKERRREEANFLVILALDIEFSWLWPNICNPGIRMLWSDAKGSERGGEGRKPDLQGLKIEAV